MNTKLITALFITLVLMVSIITNMNKQINQLKSEKEAYKNNTSVLLAKLDTFRLDSEHYGAQTKALQLTSDEYKLYRDSSVNELQKLKLKIKDLQSSSKTAIKVEVPIQSKIENISITKDSIKEDIQKIYMNNKHVKFEGVIQGDSIKANIELPITIKQYVTPIYKHKFLWWKWGLKGVNQIVLSDNPYAKIIYTEYIIINK